MILAGLQKAHRFSIVGLAEMMIHKSTFKDYNLVSPSAHSSVHLF